MHFLKIALVSLTFSFSSIALAQKPTQMGASSIQLLEKSIDVVGGYGEGHFFDKPANLSEELINQGFAMLNLFQYTDAFRSFLSATKLDKDLAIAQVGVGLSSIFLDGNNRYFVDQTLDFISSHSLQGLDKAWANIFTSLVTGRDINGLNLSASQAYQNIKLTAGSNPETLTLANWITNTYDVDDLNIVLRTDPDHAGALHYLLHLAEMRNDHQSALGYGERLVEIATRSGHAQHMYGHVLPHFNRWNEADHQFEIADKIHKDWGTENGVEPSEDWHYMHNLDLWSVTKMVIEPRKALVILAEIKDLNPGAILDYIDYAAASLPVNEDSKVKIDGFLEPFETYSTSYRSYVLSSRLFFDMIYQPSQVSLETASKELQKATDFKNKQFLNVSLTLLQANISNDAKLTTQATDYMIASLVANFERGGFDGWKASVLEAVMYKRFLQIYNLKNVEDQLQSEVLDRFMSPID